MTDENTTFSEETLKKVYEALLENGIFGQKATDVVSSIQNKGVLFRERAGKRRGRPPGSKNRKPAKPAETSEKEPEKAPVAPAEGVSEGSWDAKDVPTLPDSIRNVANQDSPAS